MGLIENPNEDSASLGFFAQGFLLEPALCYVQFYLYAIAALDGPANETMEVVLKPTVFAHLLKSANV